MVAIGHTGESRACLSLAGRSPVDGRFQFHPLGHGKDRFGAKVLDYHRHLVVHITIVIISSIFSGAIICIIAAVLRAFSGDHGGWWPLF